MGTYYEKKDLRVLLFTECYMINKADDMQPELMPRNWLQ